MKKFAVLLVFLLSACSTGGREETPPQAPSSDEQYLETLRDEFPALRDESDESILKVTHLVCDIFDAGGSFEELVAILVDNDVSAETAGALIGGAVVHECPEHVDIIRDAAERHGIDTTRELG